MTDFQTARQKIGGLKGVMRALNDAPAFEHRWGSLERCPFCGEKGKNKAGVFPGKGKSAGADFFKCHASGCSSGGECVAELGYIRLRLGLSEDKPVAGGASPAYQKFLELAGCWEDPKAKPETGKAEKKKPKAKPAEPEPPATPVPTSEDELLIAKVVEIIRTENRVSEQSIIRHLELPPERVEWALNELAKRGAVSTPMLDEPREIIKLPPKPPGLIQIKIDDKISFDTFEKPKPVEPLKADSTAAKGAAPARDATVEEPPGRLALERAHSLMSLSDLDAEMLFKKRGQKSNTSARLGFVSSPAGNKLILETVCEELGADEVLQAGLYLPAEKKRQKEFRPNSQFYGMGQKGKKPKEQRKNRDDRWIWGMVHPIIIPYFDEGGRVIKLRPHKGGAPADTLAGMPRLYIPRDFRKAPDVVETFPRVVITEGEFKAAALWQTIGAGREDIEDVGNPWGVAAVPGINFGKNYELRSELAAWLQAVQCRLVVVAYDDQDKAGEPLRERHEALIWARYLATDIFRTLHIRSKVLVLPHYLRDEKGKADWDGAMAAMAFNWNVVMEKMDAEKRQTAEQPKP